MNIKETFPKQALVDLGFSCAVNGLTQECENISNGIAAVYENSPVPFLLKAVSQLNLNQPSKALELLEKQALPLDPDNPTIKALIGFSHIRGGHHEKGHSILKILSDESANHDEPSRQLALELLAG